MSEVTAQPPRTGEERRRSLRRALVLSALVVATLTAWGLATHFFMRHRWGQTIEVGPGAPPPP